MKRGDTDFQYLENVACFKWFGNKAIIILCGDIEDFD